MRQLECDHMRFIVEKSWDLKLQIHLLEKGCTQLTGVIAHIISLMLDLYLEDVIPKFQIVSVYSCTMQCLVAKGIVRSYSMSKKRRNKPAATGIISDCDVCGGFNTKCYMHMNDAYFTPDQVMFPYEAKKIFD